jgi:hypothetical protein
MNSDSSVQMRRQTIAVDPVVGLDAKENPNASVWMDSPVETPDKHCVNLRSTSSYFFRGAPKTPTIMEAAISAKNQANCLKGHRARKAVECCDALDSCTLVV